MKIQKAQSYVIATFDPFSQSAKKAARPELCKNDWEDWTKQRYAEKLDLYSIIQKVLYFLQIFTKKYTDFYRVFFGLEAKNIDATVHFFLPNCHTIQYDFFLRQNWRLFRSDRLIMVFG